MKLKYLKPSVLKTLWMSKWVKHPPDRYKLKHAEYQEVNQSILYLKKSIAKQPKLLRYQKQMGPATSQEACDINGDEWGRLRYDMEEGFEMATRRYEMEARTGDGVN
ncbi:hypothetical protein ATANTOWER_015711 [Ataeniobius toweri]|uniref:Uncharacterized protein n=1 Tax=Ataeniobius toweri TaxID=208326 RepID=A0ABU7AFE1_9TELE|nr:hypothetical protein [Ataeniobius toweri]